MADQNALRDDNRIPTMLGVNASGEVRRVRVDADDKLLTTAIIETGDIEIGAVELKNATDDTRAKVGAGSGMVAGDNALAVADANVKGDTASILTDTTAIKTSVQTLDNIVSGSEAQVDVVASLPSGTNEIGSVGIKKYNALKSGELAGSASAVQMPDRACNMVNFKAVLSNAGNVYVGISGVTAVDGTTDTTSGFELGPGDETGFIPVDNLNRFYRISTNVGDDLTYLTY